MKTSLRKAEWNISAFFFYLSLFSLLIGPLQNSFGQQKGTDPPSSKNEFVTLKGYIIDSENKKPIDFARIVILDLNKTASANDLGYFEINNIKTGVFEMQVYRIGYRSATITVSVTNDTSKVLQIELLPRPISSETVVITGKRDDNSGLTGDAEYKMTGEKLRQSLGLSIAKTIDGEPGMSQRSMGPAPSRPVLRGLGGDRLLILEDGSRTGDLSGTSNDHAVMLDPLNADQIEVYRGPEALQFGANTIAGVVNVWNRNIPTNKPAKFSMVNTLQAESVNNGLAGGLHGVIPYKDFAITLSSSGRTGSDIQTPIGKLMNTSISNYRFSGGVSYIKPWGYIGASGSAFNSDYGIPGGFIGAHPTGVDIETEKKHFEIKSSYLLDHNIFLHHIDANFNYTEYYHSEYESGGLLGVLFGVLTYSGNLKLHAQESVLGKSTFGAWFQYRDYANGGFVFTPNTLERDIAAYWHNEKTFERLRIETAFRYDFKTIEPNVERFSQNVGQIRDRNFDSWSGAIETEYNLSDAFSIGTRFMRTFRAPGLEELYSEGPHLAAYSYEVGFAENDIETGLSAETYFVFKNEFIHGSWSFYTNKMNNYLFPKDIDSLNIAKLLPIYRFLGQDAIFRGTEMHAEFDITSTLSASVTGSYTWAKLLDDNIPVPFMPPVQGKFQLMYRKNKWNFRVHSKWAGSQNRTGEFEEPTDGFMIFGAGTEYTKSKWGGLHVISLQIENMFNTEYRNHLSRVKSVMPEPGFNASLIYRMYY